MGRRRYELHDRIAGLDPERDHLEIYQLSAGREFPWDYTRALEFALFRTYCVPSISRLLAATGEFRLRPQQRYDDTSLLMAEIAAHGYDSPRGREALKVINRAHGRFAISNDDMLYVLSTFVYDPIDWLERYGWRPPHEHEKLAAFHYYREVGKRMGIRDIPAGYEEFAEFKRGYEQQHFVFSETNQKIGEYTVGLFAAWFPAFLRPAVRLGVRGMLDEPMLRAFGFPPAPRWVGALGDFALHARAYTLRFFPPRRASVLGVSPRNRTYPGYPEGYRPADLGAPEPSADLPAEHLRRP
ncbi:oxygenase MpaB family protein [Actinoplanes regularis]|uniref:oxygenase MpaB family protein n=1 Tax=Actinoplanes regularis TaxID=52697 RepID=UPI0024A44BD8|nr:oxygenase MpaB family protein [Actinoplanes regularis]GLW27506.1 peptidase [Actinoplanes regularis]